MTLQEAAKILRAHNEWRRYDGPIGEGPEMTDPKTLGEAIDTACNELEGRFERAKELTWEDIRWIDINICGLAQLTDWPLRGQEAFYTEVLRRFNQMKEKEK